MRGVTLNQAIRALMRDQPEAVRRLAAHAEVLAVAAGERLGFPREHLALVRWEANLSVAEGREAKLELVRAAMRLARWATEDPAVDMSAFCARLVEEGCDRAVVRALGAVAPLVQPVTRK